MAETPTETVQRVYREFKRYTDDGLPNPPTGAPLPVGDPSSGVWNPKKVDLRAALLAPIEAGNQAVIDATAQAERAEEAADNSEASAVESGVARDEAVIAKNDSITAAEASGDVLFFDTYSDADDALSGLSEGQVVRIFEDETRGGSMTWYRVESAAYVFKLATQRASSSGGLFTTVALMLADDNEKIGYTGSGANFIVTPGDIIEAQGFRYEVVAADATNYHLENAGEVRLRASLVNGEAHLLAFGASETATAAENQTALETWLSCSVDDGAILVGAPVRLDFASTFTLPGNQIVHWNGLELVKQFDGEGVVFSGGSAVIYSNGRLFVEKGAGGSGPAGSAGNPANTIAGTASGDHGIVLKNRMINFGELIAWYNHGDGIHISATANMNSARLGFLRPQFNGSNGLGASGTDDNTSLISCYLRSFGNWKAGIYLPDTFAARSWFAFYASCEANARDGVSSAVYLGNFYGGEMVIYSENQGVSVPDIEFGPGTRYCKIDDIRVGVTLNNSTRPWSIELTQKTSLAGNTPQEGFTRAGSVTVGNASRYISRKWFGSGETQIMERKVFGNGAMHFIPLAGEAAKWGGTAEGDFELFGTHKGIFLKSPDGTRYKLRVANGGTVTVTAVP